MTSRIRKYENGFEFINEKGLKFCGDDFYKIVIRRKEKARRTDACVKYLCNVFINEEKFWCCIIRETTIDEMVGE